MGRGVRGGLDEVFSTRPFLVNLLSRLCTNFHFIVPPVLFGMSIFFDLIK